MSEINSLFSFFQAVRHGYWIVLDELNLAPSEVLEALNRLLDDNRELYIPETNETIRPHEHFMLFATQNPPGSYGGRKVLSRAFRNRFLEMQMDEIPENELQTILERRCALPATFSSKMVAVMQELQRRRESHISRDLSHTPPILASIPPFQTRPPYLL